MKTWRTALLLVILSYQSALLCSFPDQISFLSYFPCTHVDNLTSVEGCDIFAYIAARLAVGKLKPIQNSLSFAEELVAIPTEKDGNVDIEEVMFQSAEHLVDYNTFGIVGPAHSELANRIAPLASDKLGILQVSYSSTDVEVDSSRSSTFYRDLPSDLFVNEARVTLLNDFQWHKVGILMTDEVSYAKAAESFYRASETYIGHQDIEIAFSGTIHIPEFVESALGEMARVRLRIILGLFGPSDARSVLCRAGSHGLTTSEHVWILPSYYNPNWWKLDDTELTGLPEAERCSNEEMIDILNSALFLDPVKYPLLQHGNVELTTSVFHEQLITRTKELFPSLRDSDLTPFLLHSRATRAYEAVWLMVEAWVDVLTHNGSCAVEELQKSIEETIFCEWCNIYSACLTNDALRENCTFCVDHSRRVVESDRIMDYYGQILVSQFIDGTNCPIGFYWPASLQNDNRKFEFVKFADLESSSHCLHKLYLDASILNYTTGCPSDFWWKGRTSPPSGEFPLTHSDIGTLGLVVTCVLTAFGLLYAFALLVGNTVWRKNKNVKASSPRLNMVLLVAFTFKLPSPLMYGIVLSSNRLASPSSSDVLCQLLPWFFILPDLVLYVTLLVKNWRVYCIFHNKQLKEDLESLPSPGNNLPRNHLEHNPILQLSWWLSDKALLVFITFLVFPEVVLFLLLLVIDTPEASTTIDDDTIVTACGSEHIEIWICIITLYHISVLLALLFIGYQNTKVPSRFSEQEGEASQKVWMLTIVTILVEVPFSLYLLQHPSLYLAVFWALLVGDCLQHGILLAILFVPQFVRVYKDHVQSSKDIIRMEESERYQKDYQAARAEIQRLRTQLMEIEKMKQILLSRNLERH